MNQLITNVDVCLREEWFCTDCGVEFNASHNFCGNCGKQRDQIQNSDVTVLAQNNAANSNASQIAINDSTSHTIRAVLNSRLAVVGIIALVGPLGLPALWFSQRFSPATKIVTTLVYFLLTTVIPLLLAWYWLDYSLRPLVDSFPK